MVKRTQAETAASGRPEDERLGIGKSFTYGIQHVLTMYGGIIAPPLIIGGAAGVSTAEIGLLVASCLFIGGLATILQSFGIPFFGSRLPLVQGTSFAGVATMTAIVADGGLPAVFGSVIASAALGLLITPVFSRLVKYFPPVVTGTVITVIGLSLMPVAAQWAMGNNTKSPEFGSVSNVGLAAMTLAIVLLLSKVAVPAISRLSILLSIVVGTVLAAVLGKADFSQVWEGPIFAVPTPFAFGMPTFDVAAIVSMFIVVLVTLTETTADILAVGEIVDTRVGKRRIGDGLRADMASSAIAPVFNGFMQSAFAQNVGLVAITGIRSRFVVTAGGVILLILGMLPVLGRVVAAIPYPVLGGAGLVLFGTVAASGIKTLSKVDYNGNMNLVIVAASVGMGMIPIAAPEFYHHFPAWVGTIFHSGISSAALTAVVLNLLFNHLKPAKAGSDPSVFATATRVIDYSDLKAFSRLENGDKIVDGKIVDADGKPVEVRDEEGRPVSYRIGSEPDAHG
ncbi:nucleobase:cation symporter-2 family protein [Amycolatopsis sp. CB00013]|uniref:nucleobase:cation symporter-2 family protein n=1 Tax=Amycolatopsis sp. CB00013 TaxID=1703945 RepID=UPI00093F6176|nr:nucleobase:cation symporter-2 family protein [Amycolatopsis sp. CB00013]OKJ98808.1 uracil permease [Amycolatopsis sp. CB00013]